MRIDQIFTKPEMHYGDLNLCLRSNPENIVLLEPFVEKLSCRYEMTEEQHFNLLLILTEAVNNSMLHGNQADPNKVVQIQVAPQNNAFTIYIQDEGRGFNPDTLSDPTAPEQKVLPNGRGVFLIRQLSEHVCYHDNGRQLEIRFGLNPQCPATA